MNSRRACREAALQALCQCDALQSFSEECVALFVARFESLGAAFCSEEDAPSVPGEKGTYFRELVDGLLGVLAEVDQKIAVASEHWSVMRMSRVDRNIIRIATFEMHYRNDIPHKVSINEAIEIAKRFGADDSAGFINGVLDRISHNALQPVA